MDDIVQQALAKWPHVPHCYGWLGLDARGRWWMRDDAAQAQGPFPPSKGSLLQHDKLLQFIGRNYEADAQGQWFFQNGPQRVYVELECTPWVWRLQPDGSIHSHTGRLALPQSCLMDETGKAYLVTDLGLGLVHSQDVAALADALAQWQWEPQPVQAAALPQRYGFVLSPQAQAGQQP